MSANETKLPENDDENYEPDLPETMFLPNVTVREKRETCTTFEDITNVPIEVNDDIEETMPSANEVGDDPILSSITHDGHVFTKKRKTTTNVVYYCKYRRSVDCKCILKMSHENRRFQIIL